MKRFWPFAFYFFYFAAMACSAPFFVLYYQSLNLSGAEIGLLTGLTPLANLISSPFWTGTADRWHKHRLFMTLTMLGGVIGLAFIPLAKTFSIIIVVIILYTFFFSPIASFADSATMSMLADQKELYGRVRVGGTIGFGVAAAFAGNVVQSYGLGVAFWMSAAVYLVAFFVTLKFTHTQPQVQSGQPVAEAKGDMRFFLTNSRWLLFFVAAFAGGVSMAVVNNYLFSYLKELGANESIMGYALTAGTIGEVPILFFGNRLIKKFKPYGLFMLSLAFTGARLLVFGALPNANIVLFLQLFNGLTFPVLWMAGVAYADQNAPRGLAATAQGMFGAMVFGVGVAVGGFLGGLLLDSVGGQSIYLASGSIVLIVVAIVALLGTRVHMEAQPVPTTQQV